MLFCPNSGCATREIVGFAQGGLTETNENTEFSSLSMGSFVGEIAFPDWDLSTSGRIGVSVRCPKGLCGDVCEHLMARISKKYPHTGSDSCAMASPDGS
jgi:hypothetical protein